MALRDPDATVGPFREGNTTILTGVVKDNATPQAEIPGTSLDSMTFTLYDEKSQAIINSRDRVDIQANVDEDGVLELELTEDDMAIVGSKVTENHRALLEWRWDGDKYGSYEVRIIVSNLLKVPETP